jgi:hypothetical protein
MSLNLTMNNNELLKQAVCISTAAIKLLIDNVLRVKVNELITTYKRKKKVEESIILDKFNEYLAESYTKFSLINTMVFKNQ